MNRRQPTVRYSSAISITKWIIYSRGQVLTDPILNWTHGSSYTSEKCVCTILILKSHTDACEHFLDIFCSFFAVLWHKAYTKKVFLVSEIQKFDFPVSSCYFSVTSFRAWNLYQTCFVYLRCINISHVDQLFHLKSNSLLYGKRREKQFSQRLYISLRLYITLCQNNSFREDFQAYCLTLIKFCQKKTQISVYLNLFFRLICYISS